MRASWLVVGVLLHGCVPPSGGSSSISTDDDDGMNCCVPPYAFFNCTGEGYSPGPGNLYTCVDTSDITGCMKCLGSQAASREICTTCCADETEAECKSLDNNDWEFYLSTVFFVVLCCCFSALCGFTEARRKQKGISFAAAWSIPQAMPVLRTWPRRSVSVSDAMNGLERDESGWAPLSDDENDQKKYPVAGLVDDTGMAFGFVTSMPQSVLGSVSASLRRQNPAATAAPISPREPELTVWISRDGEPTPYPTNTGVHQAESHGGRNRVETSTSSTRRDDGAQNSGGGTRYSVANNLHEPLIFGDGVIGRGAAADGTRNGDRDGVEEGKSAEGIEVGGER